MSKRTLPFSKPVTVTGDWDYGDPGLRAAQHKALKTRRQAIKRRLRRRITEKERNELTAELQDLSDAETCLFGVRHRDTSLPLGKDGKPYVPRTARGMRHVPIGALPLNARGRPYVPSAREIVATAVFQRFVEKGNLAMALAKLAQIDSVAAKKIRNEAKMNPDIRRALNRLGSDVKVEWPPRHDELLVLENYYATSFLPRPLCGVTDYDAAIMLRDSGIEMNVARYRRILRKFRGGLA